MARRVTEGEIVIASHNPGKVREIGELLAPFGVRVASVADLGLAVPDETEETFVGNARIKAHAAAAKSGRPALSDDSGLSADALGGRPGVHTADWAETPEGRDFRVAMEKVWRACEAAGAPEPKRAHFICALCIAWPDGHDEVFTGEAHGTLVWPPRGGRGFGFDPMFVPEGEQETFGEMEPARKHAMSHRARAFERLVAACFEG